MPHPDRSPFRSHLRSPARRRARWAGAGGALLFGTGLLSAVLGAFYQVSSEAWLAPTPEVLDAAAGCDALQSRRAREACMRTLIAGHRRAPEATASAAFALARHGPDGAATLRERGER